MQTGNSDFSERIPLGDILKECDRMFNANAKAELGAFLRAWRAKAQQSGDLSGELSILNELTGYYRLANDPEHGKPVVNDALSLITKTGISGSLSAGTILLNAATALCAFGDTDQAVELYNRASECYFANLPEGDIRFAGLFNNMASAFLAAGDFDKAEEYYLQAVDILSSANSIMDMAVTYVNLAQLYFSKGEAAEVIASTLDCAMLCFNSPATPRDGYYAHTCTKCAGAFGQMGRKDYEEELLTRAREFYAGN